MVLLLDNLKVAFFSDKHVIRVGKICRLSCGGVLDTGDRLPHLVNAIPQIFFLDLVLLPFLNVFQGFSLEFINAHLLFSLTVFLLLLLILASPTTLLPLLLLLLHASDLVLHLPYPLGKLLPRDRVQFPLLLLQVLSTQALIIVVIV